MYYHLVKTILSQSSGPFLYWGLKQVIGQQLVTRGITYPAVQARLGIFFTDLLYHSMDFIVSIKYNEYIGINVNYLVGASLDIIKWSITNPIGVKDWLFNHVYNTAVIITEKIIAVVDWLVQYWNQDNSKAYVISSYKLLSGWKAEEDARLELQKVQKLFHYIGIGDVFSIPVTSPVTYGLGVATYNRVNNIIPARLDIPVRLCIAYIAKVIGSSIQDYGKHIDTIIQDLIINHPLWNNSTICLNLDFSLSPRKIEGNELIDAINEEPNKEINQNRNISFIENLEPKGWGNKLIKDIDNLKTQLMHIKETQAAMQLSIDKFAQEFGDTERTNVDKIILNLNEDLYKLFNSNDNLSLDKFISDVDEFSQIKEQLAKVIHTSDNFIESMYEVLDKLAKSKITNKHKTQIESYIVKLNLKEIASLENTLNQYHLDNRFEIEKQLIDLTNYKSFFERDLFASNMQYMNEIFIKSLYKNIDKKILSKELSYLTQTVTFSNDVKLFFIIKDAFFNDLVFNKLLILHSQDFEKEDFITKASDLMILSRFNDFIKEFYQFIADMDKDNQEYWKKVTDNLHDASIIFQTLSLPESKDNVGIKLKTHKLLPDFNEYNDELNINYDYNPLDYIYS